MHLVFAAVTALWLGPSLVIPTNDLPSIATSKCDELAGDKFLSKLALTQYLLGISLLFGDSGCEKNVRSGAKWLKLAAEQGHSNAMGALGRLYAFGDGVPKDPVLAYKWLNLAAADGVEEAGSIRDLVAIKMTPTQVAEAQRLSRNWKAK